MARVRKHDGRVVQYDEGKIAHEILKACEAAGEGDAAMAAEFAQKVSFLLRKYNPEAEAQGAVLDATVIDEMIEKVLLQTSPAVAKAFLMRSQRRSEHDDQQAERAPRPVASYGQKRLFPDDTLTVETESSAEAHHWERGRIVEQLLREADLPPALAEQVAENVEQRLYASGLKRVSTGVIRELIGAELFAQGHTRERERQAMLGVPRHDVQSALLRGKPGDEAEVAFRDAAEIDRYLHEEVLRRYTLQEVHSAQVRAAHTDGRLNLNNLGSPIRLDSLRVCPEGIKHGWPRCLPREEVPGKLARRHRAGERVAAPATEEQFLALLRRYAEELAQMVTGPVVFTNVSVVLAPLVAEHAPESRRAVLRRLLGALSGGLAQRITLEFPLTVPEGLRRANVVGLAGAEQEGRTLGDLEEVVRELARDVVALLLEGSHQALLAPDVAVAVDATALTKPEAHEVLEQATDCAARHGAPRFVLARQRTEMQAFQRAGATTSASRGATKSLGLQLPAAPSAEESLTHDAEVAVFSVALNLPQAAYRAGRGNHDGFAAECETLLQLARTAVHERFQFMLGSLARLSSALLHVDTHDEQPPPHPATLPLKYAHARLELVGLAEAMAYLSGDVEPAAEDQRAATQEIEPSPGGEAATRGGLRAVSYLAFTLKEQATHSPLELRLAEAREPEVAERFRRIDARTFPSYVESLAARGFLLPGEPYTLGVKLPGEGDPLGTLTRQGRFHTLLAPGSEIIVPPRMPSHESATVAEAVKQALWHSGAHGLAFPVYAISCPACGDCRSTPLARPAVCPSCGHDAPDYGWLLGNAFIQPREE